MLSGSRGREATGVVPKESGVRRTLILALSILSVRDRGEVRVDEHAEMRSRRRAIVGQEAMSLGTGGMRPARHERER